MNKEVMWRIIPYTINVMSLRNVWRGRPHSPHVQLVRLATIHAVHNAICCCQQTVPDWTLAVFNDEMHAWRGKTNSQKIQASTILLCSILPPTHLT